MHNSKKKKAHNQGLRDGCVRFRDIGGRTYFISERLSVVADDGYEIEVKDLENLGFLHLIKYPKQITTIAWSCICCRNSHNIKRLPVEVTIKFLENPNAYRKWPQVQVKH